MLKSVYLRIADEKGHLLAESYGQAKEEVIWNLYNFINKIIEDKCFEETENEEV